MLQLGGWDEGLGIRGNLPQEQGWHSTNDLCIRSKLLDTLISAQIPTGVDR